MASLVMESSMTDSYIYGLFNASGSIQAKILKALKEGNPLDKDYIEEQIIQIQKTRISPLADKVLTAYYDGVIRLVYWSSTTEKMTKAIPFVLHRGGNGNPVASIFISSFGKISPDGKHIDIPMKNLYILMEAAYVALNLQIRPQVIRRSSIIMRACNDVYTNMLLRVLNRDYALSIDVDLHDTISFFISKFFLERVWELDNSGMVNNYALSTTTTKSMQQLEIFLSDYESRKVTNLDELFNFLKTVAPRMNGLTVRYFLERYINTYGNSAILALDYLPYVIFVIINTVAGGFLVSQNTLSDIVKHSKEISKFWAELTKII